MLASLFINTRSPKVSWLKQALNTAVGFDEKIVYIDGVRIPADGLPNQFSYYGEPCVLVGDGQERDLKDGYNFAFENTSKDADWVCHFCDDDYFLTDNLHHLLNGIEQGFYNDCDIIHFPCELDDGSFWGESVVTIGALESANVIPYASLMRRSVWETLGGYKVNCWGDWNFWLRACRAGYRFKFYPRPVFHFRQYAESSTGKMLATEQNTREKVLQTL